MRTDKALTVIALNISDEKIAEIVRQTALSRSTVNRIIKDSQIKQKGIVVYGYDAVS